MGLWGVGGCFVAEKSQKLGSGGSACLGVQSWTCFVVQGLWRHRVHLPLRRGLLCGVDWMVSAFVRLGRWRC